jgi:WD40 repeat protein
MLLGIIFYLTNRRKKEIIEYIYSSTVVLYDIHTQKQDFIINTARKAITSLSISPDGRYLATGEVNE